MKKLFTLITLALLSVTVAHAQFGIVGGFTSSTTGVTKYQDIVAAGKNISQFHAGLAYKIRLGSFFVLQPQLTYEAKSAWVQDVAKVADIQEVYSKLKTASGFVELGLGAQVGADLVVFRPFVLVQPFIGYQVTGNEDYSSLVSSTTDVKNAFNKYIADAKNRLEYGFGVGGGVEIIRHIQVSVQWFMNLGPMFNAGKLKADPTYVELQQLTDVTNYQGVKVTLGLFF